MSALDSSVTLEDVFAVVGNKRVPLAPELAGYLVLEIAERADGAGGDVDPRSVFVGDEGTVALVKPKRDSIIGDAETSIRAALARLLEASGSQTPALAAASKRKSGGGLHVLAEELEAALIPVNRAAGRRALARLAREVKRVTMGVGRNAQPTGGESAVPTRRAPSSPSHQAPIGLSQPPPAPPTPMPMPVQTPLPPLAPSSAPPDIALPPLAPPPATPSLVAPQAPSEPTAPIARKAAASFTKEEEPTTARGQIPDEVLKKATPEPVGVKPLARPRTDPLGRPQTDKDIEASELPTMEFVPPGRAPSESQADVDALIADFGVSGGGDAHARGELKQIAGLEPTPMPPDALSSELSPEMRKRLETQPPLGEPTGPDSGISGLLAASEDAESRASAPPTPLPMPVAARVPNPLPPMRSASGSLSDARQLPTQPSKLKQNRNSLPSIPTQPRKRSNLGVVIAVLAIAAGGFAVWRLAPGLLAGRQPAPVAPASVSSAPQAPVPCNQLLIVTDVPAHAEVLLRKGQAPIDVEKMPVGARLEFVATAEGFAPKRVVVPLGAAWDPAPDGRPRYEAGVQLDKSKAPHGTNDPWPPGEPGSAVGGQGPPGTVHVVATPRGAEIWMLAGLGPEAKIEQQLACDEDLDVLVAGPTTFRKRLHVAAGDFVPEDPVPGKPARRVARVSGK